MSDRMEYHVNKIAEDEGFCDFKIETKEGSKHDDNFVSNLTAITVTGRKVQNGKLYEDKLHLLCKMPPLSTVKNSGAHLMFCREIYSYTTLLPAFMRFQHENGLTEEDSFRSIPRVFACEQNEEIGLCIIIMEDLRAQNYGMWPKEKTISIEHELFILRELGKFHAISFAMKDQRPDEFEQFRCLRDPNFENALKNEVSGFVRKTIETATDALDKPEYKRYMQNFQNTYETMVDEYFLGASSEEFAIVTHSDCWTNNFLFKYNIDNKNDPISICVLDWQMVRYCPPVFDIIYNIFSATDKPFRDQYYDVLLKTYHSSLSDTIRKLGSDPDKLYSYDDLMKQMHKFGNFALLCAPVMILFRVNKANNEHCDANKDDVDYDKRDALFNNYEDTQQSYSQLINDLMSDIVNYGYVTIE